ncbi:hypothetical protein Tco_0670583 [Tanacetum coccineum]
MKSKFGYQKESKSQQMQRQIKSESKSHSKKKIVKQTPAMKPKAKLTPIKDISPMVTNMRIRERVISKWHAHKLNQAHDPYSLELVLQDEEIEVFRPYMPRVTRNPQLDNSEKKHFVSKAEESKQYTESVMKGQPVGQRCDRFGGKTG